MLILLSKGQDKTWQSPLDATMISGRSIELEPQDGFGRLPNTYKNQVRESVWNLGLQAAGVYVDFSTEADSIFVRYQVAGGLNMPHMPTTGVSGLDLYAFDPKDKEWSWAHGRYQFRDTIQYSFENIGHHGNKVYRLYLPLYNQVQWLEIGTSSKYTLEFKKESSKPIVIYGTSIAQGACASRPGIGWTNILGRLMNKPIINLAFSGNGRLEQPILEMMNKIDAEVYVLDCIPNLSLRGDRTADELAKLIEDAVSFLRKDHPHVPIVLTGHSSSNVKGVLNLGTENEYTASTKVAEETVKALQKKGIKKLHWLSSSSIQLDVNSTVDYAHPNDIGMKKIADAYENILRRLVK
ncbi:SGNH/GDSL hydrolase family protein [Sphingobacterium sp. HJSM2_6]